MLLGSRFLQVGKTHSNFRGIGLISGMTARMCLCVDVCLFVLTFNDPFVHQGLKKKKRHHLMLIIQTRTRVLSSYSWERLPAAIRAGSVISAISLAP